MVRQPHELGEEDRRLPVGVEGPERAQRLVGGEQTRLPGELLLGAAVEHGDEEIVERREVVVHQRGGHTGLERDAA